MWHGHGRKCSASFCDLVFLFSTFLLFYYLQQTPYRSWTHIGQYCA